MFSTCFHNKYGSQSFLSLEIETYCKTRNTGTPEHRTTEHGTPVEHRNTGGTPEHWWDVQPNTGRIIGIPRNSGTREEQWNHVTTKQHQEILTMQTDVILSRQQNKIQNKNVTITRRIFTEKWNLVRRQFPCHVINQFVIFNPWKVPWNWFSGWGTDRNIIKISWHSRLRCTAFII